VGMGYDEQQICPYSSTSLEILFQITLVDSGTRFWRNSSVYF